eukprot:349837-Chlamydomonas_euryale.AAC.3
MADGTQDESACAGAQPTRVPAERAGRTGAAAAGSTAVRCRRVPSLALRAPTQKPRLGGGPHARTIRAPAQAPPRSLLVSARRVLRPTPIAGCAAAGFGCGDGTGCSRPPSTWRLNA